MRDVGPPAPPAPPGTAWALLRRTGRRYAGRLASSYLFLAVWATSEALVPVVIGAVVDRGIGTGDVGAFLRWTAVLGGLMVVLTLGYRIGAAISVRATQAESHALRVEVSAHALHPRGARSGRLPGETLALATGDADAVADQVRLAPFALSSLTAVVVTAAYLLRVDLTVGLVVLVGVPLVLVAVQVVTPVISRRTARQQELVAGAAGLATDLVRGLRPLKGIGGEDVAVQRYRRASAVARDASVGAARSFGTLFGLTTGLSGLFLAAVALLAGHRALAGDITVGELIAVVGLTQFLAEPLTGLGQVSAYAASAHASAGRIATYLATPRLLLAGSRETAGAPRLELADVSLGPLQGVTISPAPGRLTAVAVDDPAAAETLLAILRAEQAPTSGSVRLAGVPLSELTADARVATMVVSPHRVDLFEGTVRETVDPDSRLDADALARVLADSAAADVVGSSGDGVDTAVAAGGTTLSGGQRQRLGLARALAARPSVLVLHEPTTAVDPVTETSVASGLRRARHADGSTFTTVVVTASPALLAAADEVVVVRGGRATTVGTHRDLIVADADYRAAVLRGGPPARCCPSRAAVRRPGSCGACCAPVRGRWSAPCSRTSVSARPGWSRPGRSARWSTPWSRAAPATASPCSPGSSPSPRWSAGCSPWSRPRPSRR